MKKLLLIATGGTIACQKTEDGLAPQINPEDFLAYVPEYKTICTIDAIQILNLDSTNIQPEDWISMAETVQREYERYDGFVITHGTDTMAYTAAALSYLIQDSQKPIVITGSQKPIDASITDAKKNLLDSIRFAADRHAKGVYIVFDGTAIVGTRARKVRSKSYHAFESIDYPVAAFIDDSRIIHYFADQCFDAAVKFWTRLNPRIFLLKLVPGMEPDVLDYIADHYDVVVIEWQTAKRRAFGFRNSPLAVSMPEDLRWSASAVLSWSTSTGADGSMLRRKRGACFRKESAPPP